MMHDEDAIKDLATPAYGDGSRRHRAARRTLAVLPTLFTLGNCLCGFLVIFFASRQPQPLLWDWTPLTVGAIFIFLGMVFDGLDGRLARLAHRTSDLGEQLDSMADMVTFGVAPAFLAVQLVVQLIASETPFLSDKGDTYFGRVALVIACIYVACAALRLARFNIETGSGDLADHITFEGLPSPGAAGTVASMVLLHEHFLARQTDWKANLTSVAMVAIMFLAAAAMVSRLRYVHLINRYLRERAPAEYIAMIVVVVLLVFIHLQGALALGFTLYALSAPVRWLAAKRKQIGS